MIWQFDMKPWVEQIDELVLAGRYADALALLDTVEEAVLPDKVVQTISLNQHILMKSLRQQGVPASAR
jgi:hypothetical protein